MFNIIEGKQNHPLKAVIYGPEGIGKSTLASHAPGALFIDTEGGTAQMNVRRIEKPETWDELIKDIIEVSKNPSICQTLILDTADWAEMMCIRYLCEKYKKNGLEEFGYGKGYTYVAEEMARLLGACDKVIAAGMNVIIIAHAKMRKQELPDEQGAFDRWEMKLSKQAAPLLKEWPDLLLFLNYKTLVITTENSTKKATGGKRVMYTNHSPVWDAKNRFNLPDEMDMDFSGIAHLFKGNEDTATAPGVPETNAQVKTAAEELRDRMNKDGITASDIKKLVAGRGKYSIETPITDYAEDFIKTGLLEPWEKVKKVINKTKAEVNDNE